MAPREGYERLLRLAAYVRRHQVDGCTIHDIADDVPGYQDLGQAALEKALQRDGAALADSLGIVMEWSDEHQRYRIAPPYFTPEERRALIAAAATVGVEGIGENLAPGELGAAVEQDVARIVVRVHRRVVELRDAIATRSTVTFRYQGNDGPSEQRRVDPYVVGLWRNRWYFLGQDHDRNDRRVFRLDRILADSDVPAISPVGAPGAYEIPGDVNPIADLEMDPNAWGNDPALAARVEVDRSLLPTFLGELAGRVERNDADRAVVEVEVRDYESFVIRLLGFGTGVRILAPPPLVDMVREWLVAEVQA